MFMLLKFRLVFFVVMMRFGLLNSWFLCVIMNSDMMCFIGSCVG